MKAAPTAADGGEQSEPPWRAPANFSLVKTFFDSALSSFSLSFRRARVLVFPFSAQPPSLGHSPPHGFTISIEAEPRHALTFVSFFQKSLRWCHRGPSSRGVVWNACGPAKIVDRLADIPSVKRSFVKAGSAASLFCRRAHVVQFSALPQPLGQAQPESFICSIGADPRHALALGSLSQISLCWCHRLSLRNRSCRERVTSLRRWLKSPMYPQYLRRAAVPL